MLPAQPLTGGPGQQQSSQQYPNPYQNNPNDSPFGDSLFRVNDQIDPEQQYRKTYAQPPPPPPPSQDPNYDGYVDETGMPGPNPYDNPYNPYGPGNPRLPGPKPYDGYVDETGMPGPNPYDNMDFGRVDETGRPGPKPYDNPYQEFSPTAVQTQEQLQQLQARQPQTQGGLGALQQHYGFAIDPYMPPPPPPPPPVARAAVAPPPVAPAPQQQQQQQQEEYDPGPDRYQQYLQNNPDVAREYAGNTSAYGDYNNDGVMDVRDIVEGHYGQYGQEEGRAAYRRGGLAALRYR